jgi:hypothetical protein
MFRLKEDFKILFINFNIDPKRRIFYSLSTRMRNILTDGQMPPSRNSIIHFIFEERGELERSLKSNAMYFIFGV